LVVDAARDTAFLTAEQVSSLRTRPQKRDRIVLAYLSIGEAEDYRFYWRKEWDRSPPPFLDRENREWHGNFKVRYWDPEWQSIVIDYLDRIIAAGFDGVYLDVIDAFEYFGPGGERPIRKTAALDMVDLVTRLAHHARTSRGLVDFLIVPQNGATLLSAIDSNATQKYLSVVDAIGVEDTFFFGDRRENNELRVQRDVLAALGKFQQAGKPVLSVEYLTDPAKVQKFFSLAKKHRFVPCVGRRSLDRLVEVNP
jgi:cysteinyl-tRNA synthetase